jgi:hypothetical protein
MVKQLTLLVKSAEDITDLKQNTDTLSIIKCKMKKNFILIYLEIV